MHIAVSSLRLRNQETKRQQPFQPCSVVKMGSQMQPEPWSPDVRAPQSTVHVCMLCHACCCSPPHLSGGDCSLYGPNNCKDQPFAGYTCPIDFACVRQTDGQDVLLAGEGWRCLKLEGTAVLLSTSVSTSSHRLEGLLPTGMYRQSRWL